MKIQVKFLIVITLFVNYTFAQEKDAKITKQELFDHIEFLASDSMKGRFPGTEEDKIVAEYIASQFKNTGLELLFENGLQAFEITTGIELCHNNTLFINNKEFLVEKDFIPIAFSDNQLVESSVVFAGYGIKVDKKNGDWNDYANINAKDKWVLILQGTPDIKDSKIPFKMYSSLRTKATVAKDLGAAGVIFISNSNKLIELKRSQGNIQIPVIQIKRNVADLLLKPLKKNLDVIENEIVEKKQPLTFDIKSVIKCNTAIKSEIKTTYNIAAKCIIDKNNPNYIIIGAHYDHLGFGGIGSGSRSPNIKKPHYGADDNASGVSAIIEIAEKLASKKDSLNTNFIVVAFGAEEMGLIGSKYFVNNLPIPKESITSMINIDMIGRMKADSSLQISGIGTSLEGRSIIQNINNNYAFNLGLSNEGYGPSDHSSFYEKDIPVFFFSTGAHIDYHTPADSLGAINFEGLLKISNYIYDFAYYLSRNNVSLTYQESGPKAPKQSTKANLKVTLGIMPDFTGVVKEGLRADIVIKNKPAYKAGMKSGDVIKAINGDSVADIYEYMERLSKLEIGQIITVEVLRDNKKEVLIVQL
ncbi:MAG: M28 family peptidase [Bacteroidales bacterium]|nr:M28 family peptidase [Bacteroidales bacterium]